MNTGANMRMLSDNPRSRFLRRSRLQQKRDENDEAERHGTEGMGVHKAEMAAFGLL